jgi:hypothetical protein
LELLTGHHSAKRINAIRLPFRAPRIYAGWGAVDPAILRMRRACGFDDLLMLMLCDETSCGVDSRKLGNALAAGRCRRYE